MPSYPETIGGTLDIYYGMKEPRRREGLAHAPIPTHALRNLQRIQGRWMRSKD